MKGGRVLRGAPFFVGGLRGFPGGLDPRTPMTLARLGGAGGVCAKVMRRRLFMVASPRGWPSGVGFGRREAASF